MGSVVQHQQDLQIKLRERLRRLLVADMDSWLPTLRLVRDFLQGDALLKALVEEARRSEPELDSDKWVQSLNGAGGFGGGIDWPHRTEGGQVALIYRLIEQLADGELAEQTLWSMGASNNINDSLRSSTEMLIAPLFDYLVERVGNQSSVLHALERYTRAVEWFDRDTLVQDYEKDPSRGETIFDRHLRRFLFNEGIDMPFSQAASPSGESDVLAQLHSEDPLVCELKLFDAQGRGKRHVATGVHQALLYAQDYGKSEAFLVVVNLSGRALEILGDGNGLSWPPYVDIGGVRTYIVVVRARRLASASKSGPPSPIRLTRAELTDPDTE
jgi:hypothetical protein